jgi:DNA-binding XRE family transcriptional regulator
MAKPKDDLKDFLSEVAEETKAAGADAVKALDAYGEHFRLARQLLQLRKEHRWTQQEFAKKSGVPQSEISRIERGESNPTYQTLVALARSLNMTVGFMIRRGERLSLPSRRRSA